MKAHARVLVTVALVIVALIAAYFLVISPKRSELSEVQTQVATRESEIAGLVSQLQRLQELEANAGNLEADLAAIRELVPRKNEVASFIFLVQSAAEDSGVDFVTITPELPKPPPEGASVAQVRVNIGAGGGYFAVQDFLRRLYDLDRAVRIDLMSMNGVTAPGEDTTIDLDITARIFFELPEGAAPAATETGA